MLKTLAAIQVDGSPTTIVGAVAISVGSVVGLIVWIVKQSFNRQGSITDRYFAHLEEQAREQKELNSKYGDHLDRIAGSLQTLNEGQMRQNEILGAISKTCNGSKQ